jgi:hypothetical protein
VILPRAFDVRPLDGVGPVRFGMSRADVRAVLGEPSYAQERAPGGQGPAGKDYFFENAFQVTYDAVGEVDFIELARHAIRALYSGAPVLELAANNAVALVARDAAFDASVPEHPVSFAFPTLELSLWRSCVPEDDPDGDAGRHFEAIGIGRRGYIDALRRIYAGSGR